ncbi:unnamed protein product [Lactuca saligna]|uniref:Uncharacterized protein n=1 Tax=Lactuca saligna TaxID=75948 RepID=A0AA35UUU2_LACSI|nr:unnamed protein product [Lactuca saligna]
MWRELLNSVENINVVNGILCARYWSLILKFSYQKEGIQVPADEVTTKFWKYNFPKVVNDNVKEFPSVGRISDEGPYKCSRRSKKVEESPMKLIQEKKKTKSPTKKPIDDVNVSKPKDTTSETKPYEPLKEVVPSKTRVFKRIKKIIHRSQSSSDKYPCFYPSMVRKPHVTRKGVVIREVLVPISPSSKNFSTRTNYCFTPLTTNVETTLSQGTPIIVSSTLETSTIETTTTLPPFVTNPLETHSRTFDNILNQPITSLFSSQSTEPPVTTAEVHHSSDDDENVFGGKFGDIQFDTEEEDIPNNMILTGKQFKIPNQKLNSLL